MKISWHGHSCIRIETLSNHTLIFDPFISGNPTTDLDPKSLSVDYIVLTHAHNDHIGDTALIAKNTRATIIANPEIADFFEDQGFKTHGIGTGGQFRFDFGTLKFTHAIHGSTYNYQGQQLALGVACGVVLDDGVTKVYHAGDTGLFSDMSLIGPVNVALLPIGDNYTMGIADAITAAQLVNAELVIPIHYSTFPLIQQNPYEFINRLPNNNGYVPQVGEVIEL